MNCRYFVLLNASQWSLLGGTVWLPLLRALFLNHQKQALITKRYLFEQRFQVQLMPQLSMERTLAVDDGSDAHTHTYDGCARSTQRWTARRLKFIFLPQTAAVMPFDAVTLA